MFNITSGNIKWGVLYLVYSTQSVTYNGATYSAGQTFRGVGSVTTFTFSGTGTQFVYEVQEFAASSLIFDENSLDSPAFPDVTKFSGFAIEYKQNANDIIFDDSTILKAFAIELLDYPFYSFAISEIRL